jgi:hypothetical protein
VRIGKTSNIGDKIMVGGIIWREEKDEQPQTTGRDLP